MNVVLTSDAETRVTDLASTMNSWNTLGLMQRSSSELFSICSVSWWDQNQAVRGQKTSSTEQGGRAVSTMLTHSNPKTNIYFQIRRD